MDCFYILFHIHLPYINYPISGSNNLKIYKILIIFYFIMKEKNKIE